MPNFKAFNFFIGANNSGKSSVLNFISKHLPPVFVGRIPAKPSPPISRLEQHGNGSDGIYMSIGVPVKEVVASIYFNRESESFEDHYRALLTTLTTALADRNGLIWKGGSLPYGNNLSIKKPDLSSFASLITYPQWQSLWSAITGQSQGNIDQHWIPQVIGAIENAVSTDLPPTRLIPAIRQVGPKEASFEDFSGAGLIQRLAALQNPEHDRREDRLKFDRINGFLQSVTDRHDALIELPFSRDHVLVHMDNRVLPLESLGTGIHEVVMIAAFCTLAEEEIVCIEEPELHLHPLLQRKLIAYLAAKTKNQYFIATHSAAFIDTPGAAIFHVTQENGTTHIREAVLRQERYAICTDLGHRASDIVQSNSVIWVEGPSDRVYLNHWIKAVDSRLVEGIHYSIMFYGGRLLSHLSADDDEVSEFIQLRFLNRNLAILIDSDKDSAHKPINATKSRLKREFEDHGGVAWVTKGREIENYIPHDKLQDAVKKVYDTTYDKAYSGGQFDHALYFERKGAKKRKKGTPTGDLIERDVDKVKVSKAVVAAGPPDLDYLDLRARVTAVVAMIRGANHLA